MKHISYICICWFYYRRKNSTDWSTATFIAGVSTNVWYGVCLVALWTTNRWQYVVLAILYRRVSILITWVRYAVLVKVWYIRTAKTGVVCVAATKSRGVPWVPLQKQWRFGNQSLSSHSEETKKVRFFEFFVIWKAE